MLVHLHHGSVLLLIILAIFHIPRTAHAGRTKTPASHGAGETRRVETPSASFRDLWLVIDRIIKDPHGIMGPEVERPWRVVAIDFVSDEDGKASFIHINLIAYGSQDAQTTLTVKMLPEFFHPKPKITILPPDALPSLAKLDQKQTDLRPFFWDTVGRQRGSENIGAATALAYIKYIRKYGELPTSSNRVRLQRLNHPCYEKFRRPDGGSDNEKLLLRRGDFVWRFDLSHKEDWYQVVFVRLDANEHHVVLGPQIHKIVRDLSPFAGLYS